MDYFRRLQSLLNVASLITYCFFSGILSWVWPRTEQDSHRCQPMRSLILLATMALVLIIGIQAWSFSRNPISGSIPALHVKNGATWVWWRWNSGAGKPGIEWQKEQIVEVSGWASDIQIDDQEPVTLWDHYMGANAAGNTLYASYNRPEYYILEQTVVVEDETRVRVRISITPYITLDRVRLRLGHHKWYWSDATTIGQTFFATSQNTWVRVRFGEHLERVEINRVEINREEKGANFFDAYYEVSNVQSRMLIVDEVIEFGKR